MEVTDAPIDADHDAEAALRAKALQKMNSDAEAASAGGTPDKSEDCAEDAESARRKGRRERFASEMERDSGTADGDDADDGDEKPRRAAGAARALALAVESTRRESRESRVEGQARICLGCGKKFGKNDSKSFERHYCGGRPNKAEEGGEERKPREGKKCYECGEEGHQRRNCPRAAKKGLGELLDGSTPDSYRAKQRAQEEEDDEEGSEAEGGEGGRRERRRERREEEGGEERRPRVAPEIKGSTLVTPEDGGPQQCVS